jgi:hypothetical protein
MKNLGTIEMVGKDIHLDGKYDKIACGDRGELYLLSVVAEPGKIKGMRAVLCAGAKAGVKAAIQAAGGKIKQPSATGWGTDPRNPGNVYATPEGYTMEAHRLDYGMVHALFLSRSLEFMPVATEEALWQRLKEPKFTTPLLREWMPHIEGRLREDGFLKEAYSFNCQATVLILTTAVLDAIVSEGLQRQHIHIPEGGEA